MCAQLAWGRQENSLVRPNYKHTNLHHGSVISRLSQFVATFEALEAPYYRNETVFQYPGCYPVMDDKPLLVPEEFVAEESLNYDKNMSVNEGVNSDDETVKTSNLPPPPDDDPPSPSTLHLQPRRGRTSTSPLPTIKLNLCDGTTASVTSPSRSSSSSPSTGKSPRSWQKSSHPSAPAASSAR